ncbi:anti-sigma factor [Pontixanthobacter aquaemixtae]|uniref:Anti-sigma K factor RskA C-terminal domain-containing protein n=1 Tax=Pontixanthobacter aquaemixtae TaxID=1958940 RepID=A0A844ZV28_9SPHN|nr:anti-sigma factor [Pontixanthobacter aquaemixtae]MXO89399.1 hypothetical protein [Pontixanthobacter aquaemixtae]
MVDLHTSLSEDDFLTAGELALGVLEGEELTAAQRMQLSSPPLADAVTWWKHTLAATSETAGSYYPSEGLLSAVHARLDLLEHGEAGSLPVLHGPRTASRWSIGLATFGLTAAAAALVLFLATPAVEAPVQTVPAPQLIAQVADETSGRKIASIIDSAQGKITVTTSGLDAEAGKTAELWVVPAEGAPRSLGYLPAEGSITRDLTDSETAMLVEGASLAVTFEEDTGRLHTQPTLPIVLVGPLDTV